MASHRQQTPPNRLRAVVVAASATALLSVATQAANAQPGPDVASVTEKGDRLNAEAEKATEAYNAVSEKYHALHRQVSDLQDSAARQQAELNKQQAALGALATEQYRSGGMDPSAQLLFSSDPDAYLEDSSMLEQVSGRRADMVRATQEQRRMLDQQRAEAGTKLDQLSTVRADMARKKGDVQKKLSEARELLNSLTTSDRDVLARQEKERDQAQPALGESPAASGRGAAALAAAKEKIGSPYLWGATGPHSFDCSGLIQWAYGQAGVGLPRTTYEQATVGPHLSRAQLRPGDLVFFFDDLAHAGIYAGNGVIVHAPHTGASVRYESMDTVGPFEFGLRV